MIAGQWIRCLFLGAALHAVLWGGLCSSAVGQVHLSSDFSEVVVLTCSSGTCAGDLSSPILRYTLHSITCVVPGVANSLNYGFVQSSNLQQTIFLTSVDAVASINPDSTGFSTSVYYVALLNLSGHDLHIQFNLFALFATVPQYGFCRLSGTTSRFTPDTLAYESGIVLTCDDSGLVNLCWASISSQNTTYSITAISCFLRHPLLGTIYSLDRGLQVSLAPAGEINPDSWGDRTTIYNQAVSITGRNIFLSFNTIAPVPRYGFCRVVGTSKQDAVLPLFGPPGPFGH